MPSFETLDLVADAYTPILLICLLLCNAHKTISASNGLRVGKQCALDFLVLLALVYGMLLLDTALVIWPRVGLDYSTHTAGAAALCYALWLCSNQLRWLWPLSLMAYCALMRYQQYHSWADISTTLLYLAAAAALCARVPGVFVKKV